LRRTVSFGVGLVGEHEPHKMVEMVRLAEELGFKRAWIADERFFRDVYATMSMLACHTKTIEFGTCVTDPFVRHPALTAVAIATVDELSGGRANLGMGAGISGFANMGIKRIRPAKAIKEAIHIMRGLQVGDEVDYQGELISFRKGRLDWKPPRRVPIYVAGRAPKILELGGELGDGVIIGSFASEKGIKYAIDRIAHGANRGKRSLDTIEKVSWLYTCVSPNRQAAKETVRLGVSTAIWGSREVLDAIGIKLPPAYLEFMDRHTYTQDPEVMGQAMRMVPEEIAHDFSVAGDADEVAEHMADIARMGIDHLSMWVFALEGEDLSEVITRIGRDVIPKVRALLA
jgi:5,10-methylenetetrahydromethanopterin reductase